MGYVYILQNDSMPGLLKIGKTTRNSRERAKELSSSTSVPTPFRVIFELSSDRYEILEREVHRKLARYRVGDNREFFKCAAGIAIKAIKEIHSEHLKATDRNLSDNLHRKLKSGNQCIRDDAVSKLFSHLEVNPNSIRRMLPPLIYIVESDNWSYDSSTKLNAIELLKGIQQDSRASRALTTYYERIAEQRRIERNKEKELGNQKKSHISCPNANCQQKLRIPVTKNRLRITCPKCNTIFQYPSTQTPEVGQPINRYERRIEQSNSTSSVTPTDIINRYKQRNEQQHGEQQEQLRREAEQRAAARRYQEAEQRRQQEIISKYGSLEAYKRHQNNGSKRRYQSCYFGDFGASTDWTHSTWLLAVNMSKCSFLEKIR